MCKEASLVFIPVEQKEEDKDSWRGAYGRLWPSVASCWDSSALRWDSVYSHAGPPFPYPVKLGAFSLCPPTVQLSLAAAKVEAEMQRFTEAPGMLNLQVP